MEELLTVEDVARICKVPQSTIRSRIASGRLPAVRIGRKVRVRAEDVDQQAPSDRPGYFRRQSLPFTEADPLWALVGSFSDESGAWVSGDKHRALAEIDPHGG